MPWVLLLQTEASAVCTEEAWEVECSSYELSASPLQELHVQYIHHVHNDRGNVVLLNVVLGGGGSCITSDPIMYTSHIMSAEL